jgi:hypothetical protein
VCTVGGNPASTASARSFLPDPSIVAGANTSDTDFVTVVRKKRVSPSAVSPSAAANSLNTYGTEPFLRSRQL